jgi:hypothetical protein
MDLHGTYDPSATYPDAIWGSTLSGLATMTGNVYIPGFSTSIHYNTIQFGMDPTVGHGSTIQPDASSANCSDNTGSGCAGFSQALVFPLYNAINFASFSNKQGTFDASTGTPFTPVAGTYTWTGIANVPVAGKNTLAQLPITVTVAGSPLHVVTPGDFDTNYDPIYEVTPSLTTVAGNYGASSGAHTYTGVDSAMYTDTTTFAISPTSTSGVGAISGAESTTGCSYAGTIAPHTPNAVYDSAIYSYDGNLYDVTGLTFSGGSCPYTGSGAFAGVATYDAAGKLTLTAINSNDKGFMVVVTKQ